MDAAQSNRSRDSDETAVNESTVLDNPLQTPSKSKHGGFAGKLMGHKGAKERGVKEHNTKVHGDGGIASDKEKKDAMASAREESISESSIKVKQLGWISAAGLMFTEYIVIAILSFPSSYSVLGLGGGIIATLLIGLAVLYTSHVLWRFCMMHPECQDIVDLSTKVFPPKFRRPVYIIVSVMFLLNNLFIMGLHTLSGSVALNTLSDHSMSTVIWTIIMTIIMLSLSLFRELNQVALIGYMAAFTMFIAFLLTLIFLGIDQFPAGYVAGAPFTVRAWHAEGTTFVAGFNAVLNILYTYIGHILIPSYVADMRKPEDFPKALYLCTFFEVILFTLGGAIGYHFIGDEAMTSPCYGSIANRTFLKVVAAFTLPTLIAVGVLYSQVTSRFVFLRIFAADSPHRLTHTVKGWLVWIAIVTVGYIISWIIGSAIPFFNELLSLMSSLFDWWFGFVLEGLAFFALYKRGFRWTTPIRKAETILNVVIIVCGVFILVGGCYSSISAIIADYASGSVAGAFSSENNGF